jgi:hypothetical protein
MWWSIAYLVISSIIATTGFWALRDENQDVLLKTCFIIFVGVLWPVFFMIVFFDFLTHGRVI